MDKFLKPGELELELDGGKARDELEEAARTGILRTDGGTSIVVYPLRKVTLGQAIVVVAGTTVFCLEAAWDGMTEDDRERFRQAAAKGAGWIDRQVDIPALTGGVGTGLTRGGRWCAHKGYSREAKAAVRDPEAVAFGVVRPSLQSAGTIVVGGRSSDTAQYCGTCGGMTEASRRCSPNGSGVAQESWDHSITLDLVDRQLRQDMEEKAERDIDRQIREESIESDQGVEPWMTIGRQTMHRITEITDAQGWGERESEATIREKESWDSRGVGAESGIGVGTGGGHRTKERWDRMEGWMLDFTRENAEVKKELERMRMLAQGERERWEKMLEIVQELKEETYKARREASVGRGELKKWLAKLGNENKEGESIGFKNQAVIMDSLSKLHINHNVFREDHKSIYREITMLETAMGSTVKGAVAEAVGGLRLELKRIFDSLAEDTPRPEGSWNNPGKRTDRGGQSSDTDTNTESEEERTVSAIRKGLKGTIGGRRGEWAGGARRPSGRESNPIVLDTPNAEGKGNKGKGKMGRTRGKGKEVSGETEARRAGAGARTPEAETTNEGLEPPPTYEADGRKDGISSRGMPGRWDSSPTALLDTTPIQELMPIRKDLTPKMEPELSAEPEEPTGTEAVEYDSLDPSPIQGLTSPRKDLTLETISGLRDEVTICHIANEVPMEPELSPEPEEQMPTTTRAIQYDKESEEKMLRQVEEDGKRQGEADIRKEEEGLWRRVAGTESKGPPGPGRVTEGGLVKEGELGGKTGSEEEKRLKGLCYCCRENETAEREGRDGKGKTVERSDWGEEGWREAGIRMVAEDMGEANKGAIRETRQKAEDKTGDEGEKKEDPILINAPKGPKRLPRFCNLCKIYGHSELTCHLQGNAPTPGPSRHQKPFKTIKQRTPRRGLGAPRGRGDIPTKEGKEHVKREIIFKREEKPVPPRRELELARSNPEPERAGMENKKIETGEEPEGGRSMRPAPGLGGSGLGLEPEAEGKEIEKEKGKKGGSGKVGDQELRIHLQGCRAPPMTTAKGKELEWKRRLRDKVETALRKADPEAQVSVLGTSYHFSRRNKKIVTVRVKNWTSKNEVQHIVLGAVSGMEQNWSIKAAVIADWVEVVVEDVDGREKGMLASKRAEEIARSNGWKLAQRSPQWIGQNRNFDTYEGSPTGLTMTLIRRNGEPPAVECVDSPYIVYGKKVIKKLKVFQLVRDGTHNFYVNEEGYKVSSRASEHGRYAPP